MAVANKITLFVLIVAGMGLSLRAGELSAQSSRRLPQMLPNPRFVTSPDKRVPQRLPSSGIALRMVAGQSNRALPQPLPSARESSSTMDRLAQYQVFGRHRVEITSPEPRPVAAIATDDKEPRIDVALSKPPVAPQEWLTTQPDRAQVMQTQAMQFVDAEPVPVPEPMVGEIEYPAHEGHFLPGPYPRTEPPAVYAAPPTHCQKRFHDHPQVGAMLADKYDLAHRCPSKKNWIVQDKCGNTVRRFVDIDHNGVVDLVCVVCNGDEHCRDINDFSGLPSVQEKTDNYYIPGQENYFSANPLEFANYGVPHGQEMRR